MDKLFADRGKLGTQITAHQHFETGREQGGKMRVLGLWEIGTGGSHLRKLLSYSKRSTADYNEAAL